MNETESQSFDFSLNPPRKIKKSLRLYPKSYIRCASRVMYGAREEDSSLPIDEKCFTVIGNAALNKTND